MLFMSHKKCLFIMCCSGGVAVRVGVVREGRLGEGESDRGEGRGGGGCPTAVSHQHSVNCSQPVAASQGHGDGVQLGAVQGPKIPSIRRSSQFVWPYPCRPFYPPSTPQPSRPFMLWRYVQIRVQELAVPATIWERLCLFLIVFHPFTAGSAMFCSYPLPAWGSALLAYYSHPPLLLVIQDWQRLH